MQGAQNIEKTVAQNDQCYWQETNAQQCNYGERKCF